MSIIEKFLTGELFFGDEGKEEYYEKFRKPDSPLYITEIVDEEIQKLSPVGYVYLKLINTSIKELYDEGIEFDLANTPKYLFIKNMYLEHENREFDLYAEGENKMIEIKKEGVMHYTLRIHEKSGKIEEFKIKNRKIDLV